MQVFGVFFAVFALGLKKSLISVIAYLLLGCVGVPVFSIFQGGIQHIFSLNGGFLIGFVFLCVVTGFIMLKIKYNFVNLLVSGFFGLLMLYLCEFLWLTFVYSFKPITAILSIIIYFPFDILKLILAAVISLKTVRITRR